MRLENETFEVEIIPELGGRIHRLRALGHDLLRTPPRTQDHVASPENQLAHFFWGSYPLVPWANRIPNGRLRFRGKTYYHPVNLNGNAIHGEAYRAPWAQIDDRTLAFEGGGTKTAYPWRYRASQSFSLNNNTLTLTVTLTNESDMDMPGGISIHPWFRADVPLLVALPATLGYPLRDSIPTGDPQPVEGRRDRRAISPVPWGTDDLWTSLTDDHITMVWPTLGLHLRYGFSDAADHVVMAAFETEAAVAVEPMTHATDGFRLLEERKPGAIDVLKPGTSLAVSYELAVSRTAHGSAQR